MSQTSNDFLPFHRPSIDEGELKAVAECLESGWLTTGGRCREFEERFKEYVGAKYAVAVNSATAALHLSLDAAGVRQGDLVLVPTLTFAATAEVVRYLGGRPVLIDCDPLTLNINIGELERFLGEECELREKGAYHAKYGGYVRAVMPVHYAGLPCEMDKIMALAERYRLHVLEDAAHCVPGHFQGKSLGTIGKAGSFSFYANKNITTGEGGMLVTEDEEFANRVRMMSLHGMSRDAWKRFTAKGTWRYELLEPGYKYNLTDIAAALGLEQLKRADEFYNARVKLVQRYNDAFASIPEVQTPEDAPAGSQHAWYIYVIRLNLAQLTIDRDRFIDELKERGIGTSVHYIPLHLHPYYRNTYGYCPDDLPLATTESERIITIPLYPRLGDAGVDRVVGAIADTIAQNRK